MIKDLELGIKSKDDIPVQKNYLSILRPIYPEIKHYLEDLLNKKFVTRSNSSCSSSVVCVRKKDGSSRLCVDYRSLNAKPVADRHLIPLDNLGGNAWFSVLDKGKSAQAIGVGKSPCITTTVNSASVLKEELSKNNAENVSTKKEIDLLKAQHEDCNIHHITELKSTNKKLTPNEKEIKKP